MYFRYYGLRETFLDQCLKSCVSEDSSTENMENGSKHSSHLNYRTFTIFIYHCEGSCFEKVSFSNMQNPKSVC